MKTVTCQICQELFSPRKRGGNKYCSEACRHEFESRERIRKRLDAGLPVVGVTRVNCSECGCDIVFTGPAHKYCAECKKTAGARKAAKWRDANPDRAAEAQKVNDERRRDDPQRKESMRIYYARRGAKRTADPSSNLHHRMSEMIRRGLKSAKAGKAWLSMVPYSVAELAAHIERQFLPGMSWGNMGEWHIDHITPRSLFEFSSPNDDEFKACWALTNLRPLWALDNIKKSNDRLLLL